MSAIRLKSLALLFIAILFSAILMSPGVDAYTTQRSITTVSPDKLRKLTQYGPSKQKFTVSPLDHSVLAEILKQSRYQKRLKACADYYKWVDIVMNLANSTEAVSNDWEAASETCIPITESIKEALEGLHSQCVLDSECRCESPGACVEGVSARDTTGSGEPHCLFTNDFGECKNPDPLRRDGVIAPSLTQAQPGKPEDLTWVTIWQWCAPSLDYVQARRDECQE